MRNRDAGIDQVTEWRRVYARSAFRADALRRVTFLCLMVLGIVLIAVLTLWLIPLALTRHPSQGLSSAQRLKAVNDARTAVIALLIALGAGGTLLFTARTYVLTKSGQISDRYSTAVNQLATETIDVRLAGIYGLAALAIDSPKDQLAAVQVLCAFLRNHSRPPIGEDPSVGRADIQAAITVIGGLPRHRSPPILDFSSTHLEGLDFTGAHLEQSVFTQAHLERAYFVRAVLTGSYFPGAYIAGAQFDFSSNGISETDLSVAISMTPPDENSNGTI